MKSVHKYHILVFIIIFISLFFKIYYAEKYSTYTDEILSAIVAKSIGQNGIPLLPSDAIYKRAPVHHYLLAIPISLYGLEFIPMRINSILLGSLTIFIIYLLGLRITNRKVAIAAVLLLALNSILNQHSLSGRMYMTYGVFYILSFYFFYRGFVENRELSKILSFVFMILAMLSSEAGIMIGLIFGFLCLIYNRDSFYKDKVFISGVLTWGLIAYLILFYKIPGTISAFTVYSGEPPGLFANYKWPIENLVYSLSYIWRVLDGFFPFSVPFVIVMTIFVVYKRRLKEFYPLMALLPVLVVSSLFFHVIIQKRIIVTIVPLYILALCQFVFLLYTWVVDGIKEEHSLVKYVSNRTKSITIAVLIFCIISVPFTIDRYYMQPRNFTADLFKPFYDLRSNKNPQPAYLYLKKHVNKNDVIVQTTLEYGYFFIGNEYDFRYLRQKKAGRDENGKRIYATFDKENEPYYGRPLIDSLDKLKNVMTNSQSKIWLILGEKSKWAVGSEIRGYIEAHFHLHFQKNEFSVYSFSN